MRKKAFLLVLAIILIVSNANIAYAAEGDNILLPDNNLKQALLDAGVDTSGDGEITEGEMAAFTGVLDLSNKEISDITGLQYATGISELYLDYNTFHNIDCILTLTNLEKLSLSYMAIGELTGISNLTNLTYLNVERTNVDDICMLSSLNLDTLILNNGQVDSLTSLNGMTSLTKLSAVGLNLNDFELASDLVNLTYLDIHDNDILNITQLSEYTSLEYLDLSMNDLYSLTPLQGITNIKTLDLSENAIKSIDELSGMYNLKDLDISDNIVTNINSLSDKTLLESLNVSNNYLNPNDIAGDMAVLSGLTADIDSSGQNTLTLEYYGGLGTPSKTSEVIYHGDTITLPELSFQSDNMVVEGWDTDWDGTADAAAGAEYVAEPGAYQESYDKTYRAVYYNDYTWPSGDGTKEVPYLVSTPAQLYEVRFSPDACFLMTNDIDITSYTSEGGRYWNDGAGWLPIWEFSGIFDGGGYEIIGMNINRPEEDAGFISRLEPDGVVKNLGVVDSVIVGENTAGIVAHNVGLIADCYNKSDITATDYNSGGGGIVGANWGTIYKCYNSGSVYSSSSYVGGIAGENIYVITDCYNTGTIECDNYHGIGGITGRLFHHQDNDTAIVSNCYNIGNLISTRCDSPGGIVGDSFGGNAVNCYYLDTVENGFYEERCYIENVVQLSDLQMQQESSFYGFDFDYTWEMPSGGDYSYPQLILGNDVPVSGPSDDFAGGTGTVEDPYQITTPEQLNTVRYYRLSAFILMNDIDLSAATSDGGEYFFGGKGWYPIGNFAYPFEGDFDGNGYKISGLNMDRIFPDEAGQFGVAKGASIKNLGVDVDIIGNFRRVGGVAGMAYDTTIINCFTTGRIENSYGAGNFGGIVGYTDGAIELCYNKANLLCTGEYTRVGGIAGYIEGGTIKTSYNTGRIFAHESYAAGIVGYLYGGGIVTDCYNAAYVSGPGIVDRNYGYVYRSYNIGFAHGVISSTNNYIEDCYYIEPELGDQSTALPKTDTELRQESTFTNFDFSEVWTIGGNAEYPYPELIGNIHDMAEENEIPFEGGNGSDLNPYQISTPVQLDAIRYNPDKHYILVNDIDLGPATSEGGEFYYNGKGWFPICIYNDFTGSFDGNGYNILNLKSKSTSNIGSLFDIVGDSNDIGAAGVVENITLDNVYIYDGIAGVANRNYGTIRNCTVSGEIYGGWGGIVSINFNIIENCYNNATIRVNNSIGGIASYNESTGTISSCYNSGYLRGSNTGGIVQSNSGTVENCFNIGGLYGFSGVSGIVNYNGGSVSNCYNTGRLDLNYENGYAGVSKTNEGSIRNCYYLDTSDVGIYQGTGTSSNVLMKTLDEMKLEATFTGFDFENTWKIIEGVRMPVLQNIDLIYVSGVTLDEADITILVGESQTLNASVNPSSAANQNLIWQSDNESAVTVNSEGEVTGVSGGIANISVTTQDGSFYQSCKVTVNQSVEGVEIEPDELVIDITESVPISYSLIPANPTNQNVSWSSNNESVATVSPVGEVTGVSYGTATITVETEDGAYTDTCSITVSQYDVPVKGMTLNFSQYDIDNTGIIDLDATIIPDDASNKMVTWESSNESVALVDANGIVSGVDFGSAVITATTQDGGFTATCNITVEEQDVTGVIITSGSSYCWPGDVRLNNAKVLPETAKNKTVTWESSDESIATIGETTGFARAISPGKAIFTVTTEDGEFTDTCFMLVKQPVTGIEILPETLDLDIWEVYSSLQVNVQPQDAYNSKVTYTSSDNSIASVDASGNVVGEGAGTATITVTTQEGGYSDTCTVNVSDEIITIDFPDKNLKNALLEKGVDTNADEEISPKEMFARTASLDLHGYEIVNLSGLEYALRITDLRLNYNDIVDVSPLAPLVNLEILILNSNEITDITSLSNLTKLKNLQLDFNNIIDISAVSKMYDLEYLDLSVNEIISTSALQDLENLQTLYLQSNEINDLSGLSNLTALNHIGLSNNNITDLSPLPNLTNVTYLSLSSNNITDISKLSAFTGLKNLYIYSNNISDLSPIYNLPNLRTLNASYNTITDINGIENLNLTSLYLSYNLINDITMLETETDMNILHLRYNYIDTTEGSAQKQSIETLTESGVSVSYIPQFTDVIEFADSNLKQGLLDNGMDIDSSGEIELSEIYYYTDNLDLSGRDIINLSGLEHAYNLTWLNLSDNSIQDAHRLSEVKNLTHLDLSDNNISDLSFLDQPSHINQIIDLDLSSNNISDLKYIEDEMYWITNLNLRDNQISDILGLVDKPNLESLNVEYNWLTDSSQLAAIEIMEANGVSVSWEPQWSTVTGVTLNINSVELQKSDTIVLTATVSPDNAYNRNVTWSSSNEGIALVDGNGNVSAIAGGIATITVTTKDGGYTDTCIVTVLQSVTGVNLNQSEITLMVGQTETLLETIAPVDATNKSVSWTSNNLGIATVSSGTVFAVGTGTATITVTTEDGDYADICIVTVKSANIESSIYTIGLDATITGIEIDTTIAHLIANLDNDSSDIRMFDKSGNEVTSGALCTGMTVKLIIDGTVRDELTIIILGDANGDGSISITDYTLARLDILGLKALGQTAAAAADINGDGVISITDYTLMRLDILGLKKIH